MKVKNLSVPLRSVAFAAACCAMASSAFAVDFDGYMRAGPGLTNAKGASRACYDLRNTDGGHYRLGNECDFYGEFGLAQTANVNGATYTAKVMFNEYSPGTDIGTSYTSFEQMYVEAKGLDVSPTTAFWAGKRFYGRENIDMLDKFFVNMSGVGGGADLSMGGDTQLGLALFTTDSGKGFG
ncbi:MAG: carbohydrate porin, partial [Burkholderiales bacterium]|nr:carbohydrate porin [Burkholderiales bacterium]